MWMTNERVVRKKKCLGIEKEMNEIEHIYVVSCWSQRKYSSNTVVMLWSYMARWSWKFLLHLRSELVSSSLLSAHDSTQEESEYNTQAVKAKPKKSESRVRKLVTPSAVQESYISGKKKERREWWEWWEVGSTLRQQRSRRVEPKKRRHHAFK